MPHALYVIRILAGSSVKQYISRGMRCSYRQNIEAFGQGGVRAEKEAEEKTITSLSVFAFILNCVNLYESA